MIEITDNFAPAKEKVAESPLDLVSGIVLHNSLLC